MAFTEEEKAKNSLIGIIEPIQDASGTKAQKAAAILEVGKALGGFSETLRYYGRALLLGESRRLDHKEKVVVADRALDYYCNKEEGMIPKQLASIGIKIDVINEVVQLFREYQKSKVASWIKDTQKRKMN